MPTDLALDPTSQIPTLPSLGLEQTGDYWLRRAVPIFDEHEGSDGTQYNRELLEQIAGNCNRREQLTGDLCPLIIGHTTNDGQERPIVGYARNFRVDQFGESNSIVADFYYLDSCKDVAQHYTRRSVEVWNKNPHDRFFDPIALLGGTTPRRDLGVSGLQRYQRRHQCEAASQDNRYEMVDQYMGHGGQYSTFIPGSGSSRENYQGGGLPGVDDGMNRTPSIGPQLTPEQISQIITALLPTIRAEVDMVARPIDDPDPTVLPEDIQMAQEDDPMMGQGPSGVGMPGMGSPGDVDPMASSGLAGGDMFGSAAPGPEIGGPPDMMNAPTSSLGGGPTDSPDMGMTNNPTTSTLPGKDDDNQPRKFSRKDPDMNQPAIPMPEADIVEQYRRDRGQMIARMQRAEEVARQWQDKYNRADLELSQTRVKLEDAEKRLEEATARERYSRRHAEVVELVAKYNLAGIDPDEEMKNWAHVPDQTWESQKINYSRYPSVPVDRSLPQENEEAIQYQRDERAEQRRQEERQGHPDDKSTDAVAKYARDARDLVDRSRAEGNPITYTDALRQVRSQAASA